MVRGREGRVSPWWKRVQVVMKVQLGQMTVAEAAQELGVTPRHYYRLEEELVWAALGAVTPEKRGRKPREPEPPSAELVEKVEELEHERDLLKMRVAHLEGIQREMVARAVGTEEQKKKRRGRGRGRKARDEVSGPLQAAGPGPRGGAPETGRAGEGPGPGDGPRPVDPVSMEADERRAEEAGPEGAGS